MCAPDSVICLHYWRVLDVVLLLNDFDGGDTVGSWMSSSTTHQRWETEEMHVARMWRILVYLFAHQHTPEICMQANLSHVLCGIIVFLSFLLCVC